MMTKLKSHLMGHSPRGGCGLKSAAVLSLLCGSPSLSARRVWIEIFVAMMSTPLVSCHSPRGGCGLKLHNIDTFYYSIKSLSARRVWIEIVCLECPDWFDMSLSARRVWIEILIGDPHVPRTQSHSPRGGCGLKLCYLPG